MHLQLEKRFDPLVLNGPDPDVVETKKPLINGPYIYIYLYLCIYIYVSLFFFNEGGGRKVVESC